MKIAYSTDTVTNPQAQNTEITLSEFIEIIRNPEPSQRKLIEQIRTTVQMSVDSGMSKSMVSGSVSDLKKQLHFSIVSGFQPVGHDNKRIVLNGLAQIDIDFKEAGGDLKASETKDSLKELPYVVAAFISPSGVGVKAIIRAEVSKDNWNAAMKAINTKISEDINVGFGYFDSLGASQPSYMSYDEQVYYNPEATPIEYTIPEEVQHFTAGDPSMAATLDEGEFAEVCDALDKNYSFDTVWLQKATPIFLANCFDLTAITEYLEARYGSEFNTKRQRSLADMYERYNHVWGSAYVQRYSEGEHDATIGIQKYLMESKRELNNIIKRKKHVALIAPTGSGKTHYVINGFKGNKILVLPSQNQVRQLQAEFGADVYYEDEKTATKKSMLIATTYNSFARLARVVRLSRFTVFFDEAHNFAVSSSRNFWYYNMKSCVDLIKAEGKDTRFVLMTATPFNTFPIDTFKDFYTVNIDRPSKIEKTVNVLSYTDKNAAILNSVKHNKKNGTLSVIVLQNTKEDGTLGRMKDLLSDYNISVFNSLTKDTEDFKELIIEGKVDKKTDVVITTTVIKEGLNITDHKPNVNILGLATLHPIEWEQIAARFRNAKTVSLNVFRSEATVNDYVTNNKALHTEAILSEKLAQTDSIIRAYANISPYERKSTHKAFRDILDTVCEVGVTGAVTAEPLLVANWIFGVERKHTVRSFPYLSGYLGLYGWVTAPNEIDDDEGDEKREKRLQKNAKERREELLRIRTEKALKFSAKIHTVEDLSKEYEATKTDKEAKKILGQALSLARKANEPISTVLDVLVDSEFKDSKVNELKADMAWQGFKETKEYARSEWKTFYESFKIGSTYTSEELKDLLVKFSSFGGGGLSKLMKGISQRKVLRFYRRMFSVVRGCNTEGEQYYRLNEKPVRLTARKEMSAKMVELLELLN